MKRLWTLHCRRPVWSLLHALDCPLYSRALQHVAQKYAVHTPDVPPLDGGADRLEVLTQREKDLEKIHRQARLEVRWLNKAGKVSLAQRVQELLQNGNHLLAVEITRVASSRKDAKHSTTVCYNHLIRHALKQHPPKVNHAFDLYNDVCVQVLCAITVFNVW
jgi:hypothetical protein